MGEDAFSGDGAKASAKRATRWLSVDLASFVVDNLASGSELAADVLIVGSGYGGAMALSELAGHGLNEQDPLRIVVLERGQEYLPGAFPSNRGDIGGHMRFSGHGPKTHRGRAEGLFDFRVGADLNVLLANGLGGGSLINAGVMAQPVPEVLKDQRWPAAIRNDPGFANMFDDVKKDLGAATSAPFSRRHQVMNAISANQAGGAQAVNITVAARQGQFAFANPCNLCGDCFTGCNIGAKLSLDLTLLQSAKAKHNGLKDGALRIVTGATVLRIQPDDRNNSNTEWLVSVVHTNEQLRERQGEAYRLRVKKLILSAGAMGSTELLLKSSQEFNHSGRFGEFFSSNGDSVALVHDLPADVSPCAVSDDELGHEQRKGEPTITRCIDLRAQHGMVVQDLGVPGAARQLFEELAFTARTLHEITLFDPREYKGSNVQEDPARLNASATDRSMLVAIIGRDSADGQLRLRDGLNDSGKGGDGAIAVQWPSLKKDTRFDERQSVFKGLVSRAYPSAFVLPNLMHRPLPESIDKVYGDIRGPLTSVHPLGGCAMGDSGATGVVNHRGQLFMGQDAQAYSTLLVLDGSIVPTSLGINPALTIATLARRAMRLVIQEWALPDLWPKERAMPKLDLRPIFQPPPQPKPMAPTKIEMTEAMWGLIELNAGGQAKRFHVYLELWFQPVAVKALTHAGAPKALGEGATDQLTLCSVRSKLRVFPYTTANSMHQAAAGERPRTWANDSDAKHLVSANLEGTMSWLSHGGSASWERMASSLPAWFFNRGLSDAVKGGSESIWSSLLDPIEFISEAVDKVRGVVNLSSHAGLKRYLSYQLAIKNVEIAAQANAQSQYWSEGDWAGKEISAIKEISYEPEANLFRQLEHAKLIEFPNTTAVGREADAELSVDLNYFGVTGVPLFRLTEQQNQPVALMDFVSLGLYILRALLPIHFWSMRLPDRSDDPAPIASRLPPAMPGLNFAIHTIAINGSGGSGKISARLTRYKSADAHSATIPVLMIHGFSASGTTFAHPSIPEGGLAPYLAGKGHDVWVLDMRTSAGMDTAIMPWKFSDMAEEDIPMAIDFIRNQTKSEKVDVVAHCMGSAMLTLMLLSTHSDLPKKQFIEKQSQSIRRIVFSQVGPVFMVSPANAVRAYVLQWLRYYMDLGPYNLTPNNPTENENMLDRILSLMGRPKEDFAQENPWLPPWKRTPWVSTRLRMDAFYGQTFMLQNMPEDVLLRLDEFFGSFHLETLAEVLNYSSALSVTGHDDEVLVTPSRWESKCARLDRVMSLHGRNNGLVSSQSARLMEDFFRRSNMNGRYQSVYFDGVGHQDVLIGAKSMATFSVVLDFLKT
jgi:cholesterol oxidase